MFEEVLMPGQGREKLAIFNKFGQAVLHLENEFSGTRYGVLMCLHVMEDSREEHDWRKIKIESKNHGISSTCLVKREDGNTWMMDRHFFYIEDFLNRPKISIIAIDFKRGNFWISKISKKRCRSSRSLPMDSSLKTLNPFESQLDLVVLDGILEDEFPDSWRPFEATSVS